MATMTMAVREEARMSSTSRNRAAFAPSQCVDSKLNTACMTNVETNQWLSVRVPAGSPIEYVAVTSVAETIAGTAELEFTQQQCKAMVALEWQPLRDKAARRSEKG